MSKLKKDVEFLNEHVLKQIRPQEFYEKDWPVNAAEHAMRAAKCAAAKTAYQEILANRYRYTEGEETIIASCAAPIDEGDYRWLVAWRNLTATVQEL